ncbi:hypothetical protein Tco_1202956 [Tanacetum coccineum]
MLDADCRSVYAAKILHDLTIALIPIEGNQSYETLIPKSFNYLKKSLTMVKDQVFTVNLHHDGIFIASPLRYVQGDLKQITDIDFEGIKELKTNSDVQDFVKVGYENKWFVDLYVEHFDYDVIDFINKEANGVLSGGSSDEYYSSNEIEEFDDVDFHTEREKNVVIKNLTTHDPFLNKLCSNNGMFRDYLDESVPKIEGEALDDPDDAYINPIHKHPEQLKQALANDGVANGYQLWYAKNDWRSMLFHYGGSVEGELSKSAKSAPKYSKKGAKLSMPTLNKKYSGLQLQRLFWGAASSTVEELFYAKMDDLKYINLEAYEYLVARNPNSGARGRSGGARGRRGGGRGGKIGGGRGSTSGIKLMDEDDIRKSMEDEYMQGLLDEQEDLRQKQEKEHQDKLDE